MLTTRLRGTIIADEFAGHLSRGMTVIDIGCGNGVVSALLAERFDLNLTGTDIADYREKHIPFVPMTGTTLLLPDRSFDRAFFNDVLHHSTEQRLLLAEAVRVAEKVLIFEIEPGFLIRLFDPTVNWFHHQAMPVPLAFRSSEEWRKVLAEWGLKAEVQAIGRPRWWYPFRHIVIIINSNA